MKPEPAEPVTRLKVATSEQVVNATIRSYRYLRIAMAVAILALLFSVFLERIGGGVGCWQTSISAYFYTPVHSIFVATLVILGVAMLCLSCIDPWEDTFLNLAGLLAPIVAFVPASPRPDPADKSVCYATRSVIMVHSDDTSIHTHDFKFAINNNILAYFLAGALTIVITVALTWIGNSSEESPQGQKAKRKLSQMIKNRFIDTHAETKKNWQHHLIGILVVIGVGVGGVIWYRNWRPSFLAHAHSLSAQVMFAFVFAVMIRNAVLAPGRYRWLYAGCAAFMAGGIGAVLLYKWTHSGWQYHVMWMELAGLVPFVVFWFVQTRELWRDGQRTTTRMSKKAQGVANVVTG